jgi:putative phosphoribosyl transferase
MMDALTGTTPLYVDRVEAGGFLAERLKHLRGEDVVVLGLPRGGVVVAAEVSWALDALLDVVVVRKLGVPLHPELAMGAVGEGDVRVLNHEILESIGVTEEELAVIEARERAAVERSARRLRAEQPPIPIAGRIAVVVDDGIATGSTALRRAGWYGREAPPGSCWLLPWPPLTGSTGPAGSPTRSPARPLPTCSPG